MEEVKAMGKGELKKRRGMQFNKFSKASGSNLLTREITLPGGIHPNVTTDENNTNNLPIVLSKHLA